MLRSFANVRQYVTVEGGTWSSALEAANEMVEQVGQLPEFRDEQMNLADADHQDRRRACGPGPPGRRCQGSGRGRDGRRACMPGSPASRRLHF